MFEFIKKMFIVLLTTLVNTSGIVNSSSHTKCLSSSNRKFEI